MIQGEVTWVPVGGWLEEDAVRVTHVGTGELRVEMTDSEVDPQHVALNPIAGVEFHAYLNHLTRRGVALGLVARDTDGGVPMRTIDLSAELPEALAFDLEDAVPTYAGGEIVRWDGVMQDGRAFTFDVTTGTLTYRVPPGGTDQKEG